jgi:hypothetical protein
MKNRWHIVVLVLFVVCFLYDVIVWGSVDLLPVVGSGIADSAAREAPLAATYIAIGRRLDAAMPSLGAFGRDRLTEAFGDGFERIRADPTVAMDLMFGTTWNAAHSALKLAYWAAPLLLVVAIVLLARRPKAIRTVGRR